MKAVLMLVLVCTPVAQPAQAQNPANPVGASSAYRIRPGDVIEIKVWVSGEVGEVGGLFPVEMSGQVWVPQVGGVQVAGLTVDEMRSKLREASTRVLERGSITATPVLQVSVLGAVQQPAVVQVPFGATAFDAISRAQGFTANSDLKNITLLRGQQRIALDAATEPGVLTMANYPLESGDRILVGSRNRVTAQTVYYVLQALTFVATIYSVATR